MISPNHMRIAMIGQKGIPALYGGIERHVEDLALELTNKGHEVLVYARHWYSPLQGRYGGINVIKTPSIHTKHLDALTHTFTATIHALFQKVDIIHYHGVGPSLLSWMPRLFSPKTKVVTTFHCIDRYHQKWGWLARLTLRVGEIAACMFAHTTISVSKTIHKYCLNEYQTNTTLIPNGVTIPGTTGNNLITRWKLIPEKYILMVSRLVPHKGTHYLLKAWNSIKKENPELLKDYKLVIVGGSSFTDQYVETLHTLAAKGTDIVFTDWISGEPLEQLYANATLFVHPSENEGLPLTVLQAMSHSRPVLVSNIPEHQEVITDNRFWFANTDVSDLANKLVALIKKPALLNESGNKNYQTAKAAYAWSELTKKIETVYTQPKISRRLTSRLKTA